MKKKIIITAIILILGVICSVGALAAVNTNRINSITPELKSYQKIKKQVSRKIINNKIDFSNYNMYKDIDFSIYPTNTNDYSGVFDTNTISGKTAIDLLYYAEFVSVQLNNFNLDTTKFSAEQLIKIRDESNEVVEEMYGRINNFFLQTVGYSNTERHLLHDMYYNLAYNIETYVSKNFPQDNIKKFYKEYDNVYGYLETEKITLEWAKRAASKAQKEMKQLKKDVHSGQISAEKGLTKIDIIWSNYSKEMTANMPKSK